MYLLQNLLVPSCDIDIDSQAIHDSMLFLYQMIHLSSSRYIYEIILQHSIFYFTQEFLTLTSATLFRATKNQVYFKEFLIVIPEEWRPRQHYENAMDVDLDRAQVIIDR